MSTLLPSNFITEIIDNDLKHEGYQHSDLRFRFPPEPNGYLHIGHIKAIGINFGMGQRYDAPVNLRFDDTNPTKENQEYVDAIQKDIKWLGYKWDKICYSSDYFEQLYQWAILLIKEGKAYIDSQTAQEIAIQKGTPTQEGTNSPFRNRSIEENLQIFQEMKEGKHPEGTHILRAKIDMGSSNMLMRDPLLYRIIHQEHHRTKNQWCIYPMYDWTHGQSDYIENISHSLCSLEFKAHRELYEWFLKQISTDNNLKPKQREFARLNLTYTIMSKRKLLRLIEENHVSGWDDPRMPTISGLRRRGYTPTALRNFVNTVGIAKRENVIDVSLLEYCIREDLNKSAKRVMGVLDPLLITITNAPEDLYEELEFENNPEDANSGSRKLAFTNQLYIERNDFREEAPKGFFRLTLGKSVRLKSAYVITANEVTKDNTGKITEVKCTYHADSKSGTASADNYKDVKGTLHWLAKGHTLKADVRVYERLFLEETPDKDKEKDFIDHINPNSLEVKSALVEPSLADAKVHEGFQFQRLGYFCVDQDSQTDKLIFNKTVGLKDNWKKQQKQNQQQNLKGSSKPNTKQNDIMSQVQKLGKKIWKRIEKDDQTYLEEINNIATQIKNEQLKELLNTSVKKSGTRLVTALLIKNFLSEEKLTLDKDFKLFIEQITEAKETQLAEIGKELLS